VVDLFQLTQVGSAQWTSTSSSQKLVWPSMPMTDWIPALWISTV